MTNLEFTCPNNQSVKVRDGLVAALVFKFPEIKFITYGKGQTTATVVEDLGFWLG